MTKSRRFVTIDGFRTRVGSTLYKWLKRTSKARHGIIPKKKPKGNVRCAKVVAEARKLIGIAESPPHSNNGPGVRIIQSSTGAYGAPWCVSTVQYIWKKAGLGTYADDTAGAYYLADYAARHGAVLGGPRAGCAVVYHIGQGHAGTVVKTYPGGFFDAVEGNEGDAVRLKRRNKHTLTCTFILRPELR